MRLEEKVLNFQNTGDFNLGKDILNESYKLAEAIIKKNYKGFGFEEDLQSESHDAIVAAIYAFDVDKKAKFLTFCSVCINNTIKNFIKKRGVIFKTENKLIEGYDKPIDQIPEIDVRDSLGQLSEAHVKSLFNPNGSRSMQFRAKKKFFKIFKQNERRA